MTKITKQELEKLAELSRIKLKEQELESYRKDIDSILNFVSQVQELSGRQTDAQTLSGVYHHTFTKSPPPQEDKGVGAYGLIQNKFREDQDPHQGGQFSEEILNQVPQRDGNYIKVKKIL